MNVCDYIAHETERQSGTTHWKGMTMNKPTPPPKVTELDVTKAVKRYKTQTRIFRKTVSIGGKQIDNVIDAVQAFASEQGVGIYDVQFESSWNGLMLRCKREETPDEKRERVRSKLQQSRQHKEYEYRIKLSAWQREQNEIARQRGQTQCCPPTCCCRKR